MEINKIEKENGRDISNNLTIENEQKSFLQGMLGKTINTAIDVGIRTVLPEFVEDQVINIKNNLLNYGLKEGIQRTIDDAIDLGKSAIGIVTGKFENISQMQSAIQSGGIIDGISSLLDHVVDQLKQGGLINNSIASTIKQGKNIILNNVEKNIENSFNQQYKSLEFANKSIDQWKKFFEEKNFKGMENEYKKIEEQLKIIAPIQKTIDEINTIKILHELVKNNGQNFNLTQEELELAEKLK